MKRLLRPAGAPLTMFDEAVARRKLTKERDALVAIRPAVSVAYAAYSAQSPNFASTSCPFKSFVNSRGKRTSDGDLMLRVYQAEQPGLIERAKGAQPVSAFGRATCQLCGLNRPGQLDHYLAKSVHCELAIHPANVIPSCGECNTSRATFNTKGERRIVHLFDDDVANIPDMLVADVVVVGVDPMVTFSLRSATGRLAELYGRHFETLRLKARYEEVGPSRLAERARGFAKGLSPRCAAQVLEEEARHLESIRGVNDFDVALLRGAAKSASFVALLATVVE